MKLNVKRLVLALLVPVLLCIELAPQFPLLKLNESAAIVGAPMTPFSVAGVARRTTRRVVVVEASEMSYAAAQQQAATAQQQQAVAQQQQAVAKQQAETAQQQAAAGHRPALGTVVTTLPAGCVQVAKGGVEYSDCGGVFYRAAFQGNNLVYVVQQP